MTEATEKLDVYTRITNEIVQYLEQGVRPWQKPWDAGEIGIPQRHNGEPYHGVNILMLWLSAMSRGYSNPSWMTFDQARKLGAHVRKGETGTLVVYANTITKVDTDDLGAEIEKIIPFMRGYKVFNVEQIDGLPEKYYAKPAAQPILDEAQRLAAVEAFFNRTGARVNHGGSKAYYTQSADFIQLPEFAAFRDGLSYYATRAHETVHWTKHPQRLDRNFGQTPRFGDEAYAMEELVAEIGAAFLCADLGIAPEAREDHAAYIASWLKVLKSDKHAIFTAASHSQRAVAHLHNLQREKQPEAQEPIPPQSEPAEQPETLWELKTRPNQRRSAGRYCH